MTTATPDLTCTAPGPCSCTTMSWIRHTQFAGDHPFCEEHARQEKDFGERSSYVVWERVAKDSP